MRERLPPAALPADVEIKRHLFGEVRRVSLVLGRIGIDPRFVAIEGAMTGDG